MSETYSTKGAICPYCKTLNNPADDAATLFDEATDTFNCVSCGKDFSVSVLLSFAWRCEPLEDDQCLTP